MLSSRILLRVKQFQRCASTIYSPENVLCLENKEKTLAKFVHMQPLIWQTHHNPAKKAAVLIPIYVSDGKVSLVYTQRAVQMSHHRGQVSFPGGMQDIQDKDIQETALRETQEELGIHPKDIEIWGSGKTILEKNTSVTPVIGLIKNIKLKQLQVNRSEVHEVFTVTLEDLCNPKYLSHTQFRYGIAMPVYLAGKKRIWGLTAAITYFFLKALLPSRNYPHHIKFLLPVQSSTLYYPK